MQRALFDADPLTRFCFGAGQYRLYCFYLHFTFSGGAAAAHKIAERFYRRSGFGMGLTELQRKIIASVQQDIPVVPKPYKTIAESLGIPENRLLAELEKLCDREVIRRFGATLRHQKSGYGANAMAAWQVDESHIEAVGKKMASFKAVSHCYRRNPTEQWPYNLYTMIHAADPESCRQTARSMAEAAGIDRYTLLFSVRELKKTSMQYFSMDEEED
jgi:DNA-binding Lrp family transcriptional regulator